MIFNEKRHQNWSVNFSDIYNSALAGSSRPMNDLLLLNILKYLIEKVNSPTPIYLLESFNIDLLDLLVIAYLLEANDKPHKLQITGKLEPIITLTNR